MTSNNQQVQEMTPNNAGRKSLSKKTLSKVFRRSIGYNATYNYPRQQNCGFCFSMIPAIKELYEKKEDQIAALKRHLNFFLTAAYLTIIPFKDKFDKTLKLYSLMTTKPEEVEARKQKEMEE